MERFTKEYQNDKFISGYVKVEVKVKSEYACSGTYGEIFKVQRFPTDTVDDIADRAYAQFCRRSGVER